MIPRAVGEKFVPLSHALCVGQWDKTPKSGTNRGTTLGQVDLKALARKVLERDKTWDKHGTKDGNSVGQNTPSCPTPRQAKTASPFALPPPGEPLKCLHCFCWTPKPGSAWWAGTCSVSGRAITAKSTCDRGLEDWQATPQPQTEPQTPQEARK